MKIFNFLKKKELEEIYKLKSLLEKYQPIIDVENKVIKKENELLKIEDEADKRVKKKQEEYSKLSNKYRESLELYKKLRKEMLLYENSFDLIEYGIYEPVYDFEKSDQYREEQKYVIEIQKEMIKSGEAAICTKTWTVDGSIAKGKANTKKYIKLTLRAFNGECQSLISKARWNNINQISERIKKSFEIINKIGVNQAVYITDEYLDLKLQELKLEYEYQLKKQEEKEEQRAMREAMREEEKAKKEYEKAQREAEKEESDFQKAIEKARKERERATGDKLNELTEQIKKLEKELEQAHEKKERAISMAQQTKRGHVYVISNIGSFGEGVYKIGLTRRLEPRDRIRELGDASVPFHFDTHAMIFSEDAPSLETELHKAFEDKKVNMLNNRKEFFKINIEEIHDKINQIGIEAEFIRLPEANEYRETLALLEKLNNKKDKVESLEQEIANEFPNNID